MITLNAKKRIAKAKTVEIKDKKSDIKAVVYGPKVVNTPISIEYADFIRVYNTVGTSGIVSLDIEGSKMNVLIHSMSLHPVQNSVAHVDFYCPEAGKKVTVKVPLNFIGESEAVKAGALLVKILHEIEVEAMPENLPHDLEADISKLVTLEDDIKVGDIKLPKGVVSTMDAGEVIASVVEAKEEVEEVAVDLSAIEVEKKGKADTAEESAA